MTPSLRLHFTEPLMQWFDTHGRKNLPWQGTNDAYRIWISEIMLQQTQVKTVIPYFLRFMDRFPTIQTLAAADEETLLAHWSGLGYYSRAHNILKTAVTVCKTFNGLFPKESHELVSLPGIGPSTAAAIASQAFNQPTAILDGNVKRVLSRYFKIAGSLDKQPAKQLLWDLAQRCMQETTRYAQYTQAIMDLGALCCTVRNPTCSSCPLKITCQAYQTDETSSYPERKKRNQVLSKQQFILFYTRQKKIYLEKRPASGLWRGLWCTPMIDLEQSLSAYVLDTYGFEAIETRDLLFMKHALTHIQFHIYGRGILCEESDLAAASGQWIACDQASTLGLAKPTTRLIDVFAAMEI